MIISRFIHDAANGSDGTMPELNPDLTTKPKFLLINICKKLKTELSI